MFWGWTWVPPPGTQNATPANLAWLRGSTMPPMSSYYGLQGAQGLHPGMAVRCVPLCTALDRERASCLPRRKRFYTGSYQRHFRRSVLKGKRMPSGEVVPEGQTSVSITSRPLWSIQWIHVQEHKELEFTWGRSGLGKQISLLPPTVAHVTKVLIIQ